MVSQKLWLMESPSQFSATGMTVGCIMMGTKISAERPTSRPKNSRGVTPTIVNGTPEREIVRSMTDRSSPYRWFQ
jgi:hypothetical protein